MSVHDFEKQVQAKMEQLKLRPSEAVWTNVNMRVRKERRRRRMILWMPILLLMLGAGGYFLYNESSHKNTKLSATEKNSTHNNAPSSSVTTVNPASTGAGQDDPANSLPSEITNQEEKNASSAKVPSVGKTDEQGAVPANASPAADQPTGKETFNGRQSKTAAADPGITPPASGQQVNPGVNDAALDKSVTARTDYKTRVKNLNQSNPKPIADKGRKNSGDRNDHSSGRDSENASPTNIAKLNTDGKAGDQEVNRVKGKDKAPLTQVTHIDSGNVSSALATVSPVINAPAAKSVADSIRDARKDSIKAAKKAMDLARLTPPPKRKPSSWSFGITAEGGGSHISKGSPFDLLDKKNEEPENLAPQNSPNTSAVIGGPAGFAQAPSKPSSLKTGFSWSAGGFAQKKISERVSISAGLQYTYFSQKTDVGQFMKQAISVSNQNYDQVIQSYYTGRTMVNSPGFATATWPRPPKEQAYTNKYHFIEMPLKVHWRITNEEQVPVILDGGISLARLLSTNALHYDGANDVYYKDYTYFNKLQAGVTAGVNIALFNESNHPVWIGPTIKYQLSNLLKSDLSNGQHLWSFGLGARMFLKKQ